MKTHFWNSFYFWYHHILQRFENLRPSNNGYILLFLSRCRGRDFPHNVPRRILTSETSWIKMDIRRWSLQEIFWVPDKKNAPPTMTWSNKKCWICFRSWSMLSSWKKSAYVAGSIQKMVSKISVIFVTHLPLFKDILLHRDGRREFSKP